MLLILSFLLAMTAPGQPLSGAKESYRNPNGPLPLFGPPGNLWDNGASNSTDSVASQNGATFFARTVDDFVLDASGCPTDQILITRIRLQMVQFDSAGQSFGVEIFADDGSGTRPDSFTPILDLDESTQVRLGQFGMTSSLFEVEVNPADPLVLPSGRYWISGFGTAQNANFLNFFAASDGMPGEPPNGLILSPNLGVPDWTPVQNVIGPPPLHLSFALDGGCFLDQPFQEVPTLNAWGMIALFAALSTAAALSLSRRRSRKGGRAG